MQAQQRLYPFVLEPVFKYRIWGGRRLETMFGKKLPPVDPIGESWEITCRGEDNSVIRNGALAGKTLRDVLLQYPNELLGVGNKRGARPFPLLNKFIDANELLSVQVHPDEGGAARYAGAEAKTEAWYILHAEPGATLVKGLKRGTTRKKFEEAIRSNTVPAVLNTFPVRAGDTVYVPAGCVHAMGAGLVVCEIQENSDTTFRVYDWGRVGADGKPRQLHIEQALEVINFDDASPEKVAPVEIIEGRNRKTYLVACPYFAAELLDLGERAGATTSLSRFDSYMVLKGNAAIRTESGDEVVVSAGDSVLIPASVGDYFVIPAGGCSMIKVYVPDIAEVAARLRSAGVAEGRVRGLIFE
ncbi:MAG: mannose-6-phosphate isomerase [Candidatus Abyssobacteria bacterium SURF_5]|uniref:Phosphohexomutase n=1 Tax=Abyssobacteria bacterium (strain SURF_5) TaxID=2093360 RepID=A0A3A4N6A7_ABYX5|nr:MAG: mannose-6-phosphate isomerase [Candidatus Abyssubacteria bacterium SURF_5]